MAFINDEVFDQGLDYADTNGTRIDICKTEPASYSSATTEGAVSLGNKTGLNTGITADGSVDGRRVSVPPISDGTVTADGTAAFWALTDGAAILVATGALAATQVVTSGNTFTLDQIEITIRDATSV
jgi:hypothetical protein